MRTTPGPVMVMVSVGSMSRHAPPGQPAPEQVQFVQALVPSEPSSFHVAPFATVFAVAEIEHAPVE
jgi:hypothetical protein